MSSRSEQGFSLIEVILVVVIIGLIAAMAVPAYQKGMWAAENGSAYSAMRTMATTQATFFTQNGRFGRLDEINRQANNVFGVVVGDSIVRGRYVFTMTPARPVDDELRTEYSISARRNVVGDVLYQYELDQSGKITQVYPAGSPEN